MHLLMCVYLPSAFTLSLYALYIIYTEYKRSIIVGKVLIIDTQWDSTKSRVLVGVMYVVSDL